MNIFPTLISTMLIIIIHNLLHPTNSHTNRNTRNLQLIPSLSQSKSRYICLIPIFRPQPPFHRFKSIKYISITIHLTQLITTMIKL
ncbi:hypothetical protein BKA69DRAFT_1065764 [Paraphysoderma sedebokerense]|nr:hypothetical protein BKA69DRAFT_1065764 [Paraphysoderma sedebokerense]